MEEEGLPRLSRVHSVTLQRPWLNFESGALYALTAASTEMHTAKPCIPEFSRLESLNSPPVAAHIGSPGQSAAALLAMAAWTVLDPAKEARAALEEMARQLADDPSMPAPAPPQLSSGGNFEDFDGREHGGSDDWQRQFLRGPRLPVRFSLCYSYCTSAG